MLNKHVVLPIRLLDEHPLFIWLMPPLRRHRTAGCEPIAVQANGQWHDASNPSELDAVPDNCRALRDIGAIIALLPSCDGAIVWS